MEIIKIFVINKENVVSLTFTKSTLTMNLKIIYFISPGCSICTNQSLILNELESEMDIKIENHLITSAFDKALTYGVKSAPALVFLYAEKPKIVKTGFQSKEKLKEIIKMITPD